MQAERPQLPTVKTLQICLFVKAIYDARADPEHAAARTPSHDFTFISVTEIFIVGKLVAILGATSTYRHVVVLQFKQNVGAESTK